jgi:hypothetical protein
LCWPFPLQTVEQLELKGEGTLLLGLTYSFETFNLVNNIDVIGTSSCNSLTSATGFNAKAGGSLFGPYPNYHRHFTPAYWHERFRLTFFVKSCPQH